MRLAGPEDGVRIHDEFEPQVLFLDYYLDEGVSPASDVGSGLMAKARRASLALLREIVTGAEDREIPAIVLMSSRDINDVGKYRHQAGDRKIMSLRFLFLKKETVRQEGGSIVIEHAAADTLLDINLHYSRRSRFDRQRA